MANILVYVIQIFLYFQRTYFPCLRNNMNHNSRGNINNQLPFRSSPWKTSPTVSVPPFFTPPSAQPTNTEAVFPFSSGGDHVNNASPRKSAIPYINAVLDSGVGMSAGGGGGGGDSLSEFLLPMSQAQIASMTNADSPSTSAATQNHHQPQQHQPVTYWVINQVRQLRSTFLSKIKFDYYFLDSSTEFFCRMVSR